MGSEIEGVGDVELVLECEGECGEIVCEEKGEGAGASVEGDGEKFAFGAWGQLGKEVIFVEILVIEGELLRGDGIVGDGERDGDAAVLGLEDELRGTLACFIGENEVLQIHLKAMRNETHRMGGEEMRLKKLLAVCVPNEKTAVDKRELANGVVVAVLLQMKTACGINQRFLLHVALNDGAEIIDACLTIVGIECGGEDRFFAAVDVDGQVDRAALEVGELEYVGNARCEAIALGIIIVYHHGK